MRSLSSSAGGYRSSSLSSGRCLARAPTPERLGTAASRFAAEIEALLRPLATDGLLTEVVATYALIARRPGGEEHEQGLSSSPRGRGWGEGPDARSPLPGRHASCCAPPASAPWPAWRTGSRSPPWSRRPARRICRCCCCCPTCPSTPGICAPNRAVRCWWREPPEDANPQTAPRVTITGLAERIVDPALKARYLAVHPYAALYADFGDFSLWLVRPQGGLYVGGFGRAARLRAAQL